jgi:TetR/AcrR family transcriptional regulator, transcriptional repressor for nem operon
MSTSQPTQREQSKQATRDRVIAEAARAIRADGIAATGVAAVMLRAGLTHGGFYAHFASKDALLGEAVTAAFDEAGARFDRRLEGLAPAAALGEWIDQYVSTRHRDAPATGCALTALSAEAARSSDSVRASLAYGVERMTARLTTQLTEIGVDDPAARASAMLAEAVGAVTLARLLGTGPASDAMLAAARATLRAHAGLAS